LDCGGAADRGERGDFAVGRRKHLHGQHRRSRTALIFVVGIDHIGAAKSQPACRSCRGVKRPTWAARDFTGSSLTKHPHLWLPNRSLSASITSGYPLPRHPFGFVFDVLLDTKFSQSFRGRRSSPRDSAIRHYSPPTKWGRPRERIRIDTVPAPRSVRGTEQYAHGAAINQRMHFDEARRSWIALSTRPDSQPRND
jgi:hypothetical protein